MSDKPTAIDVCCGAGLLTLGLKKAGFNVVAGIELEPEISKTYRANHPEIKLLEKDLRKVTGKEIFEVTGYDNMDLVAGCPPCQGFSQLTAKYGKKDPRNDLVIEMGRLVEEIKPRMVMMENVPGLNGRGKRILNKFVRKLKRLGYLVNMDVLQMADFGVPQSRNRFVLLAGKGFKIPLPEPTHCRNGNEKKGLKPWLSLRDVLNDMDIPVKLSEAKKMGGPKDFGWHVTSDLMEISLKRLEALGPGDSRMALPEELRPACHKSGKGFSNVYGRLSWGQTPPTMTSGFSRICMGRFGHPDELRALSIREAALIQTFPMDYEFDTDILRYACEMVGNALPYDFAVKASEACLNAL